MPDRTDAAIFSLSPQDLDQLSRDLTRIGADIQAGQVNLSADFEAELTYLLKQANAAVLALRLNEERFRVALQTASIVIFHQDPDLRYTWVYEPLPGLTREQVLGRTDAELLPPEAAGPLTELKRQVLASGRGERQEVSLTVEGTARFYDLIVEPLRDPAGKVSGLTGAAIDITRHKQLEFELQASEERLRLALHAAGMVAWEFDAVTGQVVQSDNAPAVFGTSLHSSAEAQALIHPDDRARVVGAVREAMARKAGYMIRYRIIRPDTGEQRWLEDQGRVTLDRAGNVSRIGGIVYDITTRQQAEVERERLLEQLAFEHEQLRTVIQQLPAGVIVAEAPSGQLLLGNNQVEAIWGHPFRAASTVEGYSEYRGFHPDGRPYAPQEWPLARSIGTGEVVVNEEIDFLRGDSTCGTMLVSSAPIRNPAGEIVAGVVVFEDITELRVAQRIAQRSLKRITLLQRVTAGLSGALTPEQVAQVIIDQAVPALGAAAGTVNLLTLDGNEFDMILAGGRSQPELASRWLHFPVTLPTPMADAVRLGRPVLLGSRDAALAAYPPHDFLLAEERNAWAVAPLLSDGRAIGAMGFSFAETRAFSPEDQEFLLALAGQCARALERARLYEAAQAEISTRIQVEQQLKSSLQEKEILLREVNHRVRNNLQAIYNILYLQAGYATQEETRTMLRQAQDRVRSIALVHEKLLKSRDLVKVDFAGYVESLAAHLLRSYQLNPEAISLQVKVDSLSLDVETAVPLGVIMTELISNALKHAFPPDWLDSGRTNEIRVELQAEEDNRLRLVVSDNGVGLPADVDVTRAPSLGLQLVHLVSNRLQGAVEVDRRDGATFRISFTPITVA